MQTYIHARLNPFGMPEHLQEDAQARAAVFRQRVQALSVEDLRHFAVRRANRIKPVPPYIPFAIAVDEDTAAKLRLLPKGSSISALVQTLLAEEA